MFWLNKCQDNKLSTNLTDASNLRFVRLVLARITLILKSQNKKRLAAKYFKLWNYETLKRARIVNSIGLSILSIYNLFKQVYIYIYIYIYSPCSPYRSGMYQIGKVLKNWPLGTFKTLTQKASRQLSDCLNFNRNVFFFIKNKSWEFWSIHKLWNKCNILQYICTYAYIYNIYMIYTYYTYDII